MSRFERETLTGFVNPQTFLTPEGMELLTTTGNITVLPFGDVKFVCFVRDFHQGEPRQEMRLFTTRPKQEGLWVRMRFRDSDEMDGILANNLLAVESAGFTVIPPDPGYQNQRLFVPKAALSAIQVLGVIGSPLTTGRARKKPPAKEQMRMFEEAER